MWVLSHVQLFATPWTVAHKAPLSMEFCKQEYWMGLPFPTPGGLPNPEIELACLAFHVLAGGFFTTEAPGKPRSQWKQLQRPKSSYIQRLPGI